MSTSRNVTLWCDHSRRGDRFGCSKWIVGGASTVKDARADARKSGWSSVPGRIGLGGRDFCPVHAAKAEVTQETQ